MATTAQCKHGLYCPEMNFEIMWSPRLTESTERYRHTVNAVSGTELLPNDMSGAPPSHTALSNDRAIAVRTSFFHSGLTLLAIKRTRLLLRGDFRLCYHGDIFALSSRS